jgi:hypothetical protein
MGDPPVRYPELARLVNDCVDRRYGGVRTRLAEDLDLTLSYVGRVALGEQKFGIEMCLKFADLGGIQAATVLEASGWGELVPSIQRHFGRRHAQILQLPPPALPGDQQKLVRLYGELPVMAQRAVLRIVELMVHRPDNEPATAHQE